MSMLSQYFDYTEIGERTKLLLFWQAYRLFNNSLPSLTHDPDPVVSGFAIQQEACLQELEFSFKILGIFEEYQNSIEAVVNAALDEGISYDEAYKKLTAAAA